MLPFCFRYFFRDDLSVLIQVLNSDISMGSIAMEEYDLLGDSKYRRCVFCFQYAVYSNISCLSYMTQVDRALKGFESTAEWADLIVRLIIRIQDDFRTNVG